MKKLLLMFLAAATLLGCSKNGEVGPKGDKGDQGEVGTKGETGIDGTVIHSGSTNPSLSTGKNGDYYINLTTGSLYGPKTSTSWGSPTSLKGDKGDAGNNGTNGSKIYSGDDVPSYLLGTIGDFYFSKVELAFYGPKTSASWGNPIPLANTQKSGVQTFLIRNIKVNNSTIIDYTGDPFNNGSATINIPNVNLKRGIYFIYSRFKDEFTQQSNVTIVNYDDFSWDAINTDRDFDNLLYNETYLGDNYRFKLYQYGVNKDNIKIGIIGNATNTPSVFAFKNWINEVKVDVLIKYIPEASVSLLGKNEKELSELLSIKSK